MVQHIIGASWALAGGAVGAVLWHRISDLYEWEHPEVLWGLAIVPPVMAGLIWLNLALSPRMKMSSLAPAPRKGPLWVSSTFVAGFLYTLAASLLILVLARPHSRDSFENVTREGIDIVIAVDLSASMLAMDFKPNRLESARRTAFEFVQSRPDDRFGLVLYEGEAYTRVPLTTDHRVMLDAIESMNTGLLEGGTAIGMGLATAVNRMRKSEARSKVVILLTDGVNNRGSIAPIDAGKMARAFDIRVYAIGVGTRGKAKSPVAISPGGSYIYDWVDVEIDEELLKTVAKTTGGRYFRATSEDSLREIYREIDQLEKTKFNISRFSKKTEEYAPFALAAFGLLAAAMMIGILTGRITP
jgi:Ca-activated chloride channel homolog